MRYLKVGQWLGQGNRIAKMRLYKYGWKATDTTGADYRQPDFPHGLKTFDSPTDGRTQIERTPWPQAAYVMHHWPDEKGATDS